YHHGMEDLKARTLRMIGDPETRYREDPVRMLRVVRFAGKLRFDVEPPTKEPIARLASLITNVPAARLFDEMVKLLCSGQALSCLHGLREAGLHQGTFPLLDDILDHEVGEAFLTEALLRTDQRVHEGKPLSMGFLFATLLWHLVLERWEVKLKRGEQKFPALFEAMDETIAEQYERTAIPRRITGDMREIWAFQPRFEKRAGKQPFRMVEQVRFRAALDFFELRAHTGEVEKDLAVWWRQFYDQNGPGRQDMMEALKGTQSPGSGNSTGNGGGNKKRRRRRKPKSSNNQAADQTSPPND
ncbi:MAG: polynucleotide adenylyltransferase PcnB, partial [Limnobacter sp.]|nr:polynucleotide adenylyltransferase PcnB [Limnobacter sp.]